MSEPLLHGYFRSSASYRVRIALALKGIVYDNATYSLREGAQRSPEFLAINPQGLVPALDIDGAVLTQSLAIIEYLDETHGGPPLLPTDPLMRAHVRAAAQVIAVDIHPVQNLKILGRVQALGGDANAWAARVIEEGFAAFDTLIAPHAGRFCFGDTVSLADVCLVPQLVNARRFGVDAIPERLLAIEAQCLALPAFDAARPENQPDAF